MILAQSTSVDFVDHFRAAGVDVDYGAESRWVRDEGYGKLLGGAIARALASAELGADAIDHLDRYLRLESSGEWAARARKAVTLARLSLVRSAG